MNARALFNGILSDHVAAQLAVAPKAVATFPTPSETANARMVLEQVVEAVEIWQRRLARINSGIETDPSGNVGQRLDEYILRGQHIIGERAAFLTGIDISRLDSVRGMG